MKWDPKAVSVPNAPLTGVMTYSGRSLEGPLLCVEVPEGSSASVLLYRKGSREPVAELPFPDLPLCGRFRVMKLEGIDAAETEYNFRIGDRVVTDPSARLVRGLEKFGDPAPRTEHQVRGAFMNETYDWGGDTRMLQIPFSESVLYELHVRSFTKSPHSGVKHKGTFLGLEEKLPYLKSLGITGVVLMPCFEFDEVRPEQIGWRPAGIPEKKAEDTAEALPEKKAGTLPENTAEASSEKTAGPSSDKKAEPLPEKAGARKTAPPVPRLNVWGYGPGWYFAPKRSYCATSNPADEFRHMVRAFHEAGIEVLMEMSFPDASDPCMIRACLIWWRQIYHVDGFLLYGQPEEITTAVRTGALSDVKILYHYFDTKRMFPQGRPAGMKNLAEYNLGFREDARRFLKGDADTLGAFVSRVRCNPEDAAVINGITGHNGFTLLDLVSYNDKHNEANGEYGRDGAETEYSWNCGVEGASRKKDINRLRLRQMKNALALMLLSQGTPMITAGDEMLHTQDGNSNPYCHDSSLTWLGWKDTKDAEELFSFVKELIAFRKAHPILHAERELKGDTAGGPFPDFSCHGSDAWFASFDRQERSIGLLYCSVGSGESSGSFDSVYIAYNMHWEERSLALPYLPKGYEWDLAFSTEDDRFSKPASLEDMLRSGEGGRRLKVPGRSILVLTDKRSAGKGRAS